MTKSMSRVSALTLALTLAHGGRAGADEGEGRVTMPLKTYRKLQQRESGGKDRGAPAGFALGNAAVEISASESGGAVSARVEVTLDLRVNADRWTAIPVLAAGTPVNEVVVDGEAVQLSTTAAGLTWSTGAAGAHSMKLSYQVDASRTEAGYRLSIPVPAAAATRLTATLPGGQLEAAVIPAAGVQTSTSGGTTTVQATVPATTGVLISWRRASTQRYAMSRAVYRGRLVDGALAISGTIAVELLAAETVTLPLLPATVTLQEALVDGKKSGILVEEVGPGAEDKEMARRRFATLVRGRGTHHVTVSFLVPLERGEGPPGALIQVPEIPVSRFELTLPGKKEVSVEPTTSVAHTRRAGGTVAAFNVPLATSVKVRWSESVPTAAREETRANAEVYHLIHAVEGVLHARAVVIYQVSRGETNTVALELPAGAQVNRISAKSGAVADWRASSAKSARGKQQVTVFLDRKVRGKLVFGVDYELLLGAQRDQAVAVPLTRVLGTHRQRGMAVLLATKELALKPDAEVRVNRVGENQLPAFVRKQLKRKVGHTYRYTDPDPMLTVRTTAPTRTAGRFDARVDTLISLADVALQGSARVEINVKSGSLTALRLTLPEAANLLSLSAPSLRAHTAEHRNKAQVVDLQFTQEMEGQFKIDVIYERILADNEKEVRVPTLAVRGAEVEQGRIAVEALAAVEVKPAATDHLSSLDVGELPRQLVLKTTNPILLAYKYAHITPPYRLRLRMTRHREVDVQATTIDDSEYLTLYTRDGLAVTRARFSVRNTRRQFLKVELPPDSEVWSAFVAGQAVKPALDQGQSDEHKSVLIKILSSATGFSVELIYATRAESIGGLGTLSGRLPRPDAVVTHTRWDVYVPEGLSYRPPQTNMELLEAGTRVPGEAIAITAPKAPAEQQVAALRIAVPAHGVRYRFSKLYANQADAPPSFQLAYASRRGALASEVISIIATLALWLGAALFLRRGLRRNVPAMVSAGLGFLLLGLTMGYLQRGAGGPFTVSVLILAGLGARRGLAWHRRRLALKEAAAELEAEERGEARPPMPDGVAEPDPSG